MNASSTIDFLVAHPFKHHVLNLAAGCIRAGAEVRLYVPLYRKGVVELASYIPANLTRKIRAYKHARLDASQVVSPLPWQFRRLGTKGGSLDEFARAYDRHVAGLIRKNKVRAKVLVTLQDYMPQTVFAARQSGAKIWSDQILNRSVETRRRIAEFSSPGKVDEDPDRLNGWILRCADVVTAPSHYALTAVNGRVNASCQVHTVPYGVDQRAFSCVRKLRDDRIHIVARANDVRKGGHLLVAALDCAPELLRLSGSRRIHLTFVGQLDAQVESLTSKAQLPPGLTFSVSTPPHSSMPDLLSTADLFVMPSLSEGMSLICVEAMQVGIPMLISEYCGVDAFKPDLMGLETGASVESLRSALIAAFNQQGRWGAWGQAAKTAAAALTWDRYEASIAEIASGVKD